MAKEYKASVGSISHGTHRASDLIDAYAYELGRFKHNEGDGRLTVQETVLLADCDAWLEANAELEGETYDQAEELLEDLCEALESRAPAYCYFGSHEGDGSDFGFWPCMGQINDLPRVEHSDEAKALGEDCAFVNDHGNVTVYGGDGSVILELV